MKRLALLLFLLLVLGCTKPAEPDRLIGKWTHSEKEEDSYLEFDADGMLRIKGNDVVDTYGTWRRLDAGTFEVEMSKETYEKVKKLNDQLSEIEHLREVINEQERMLEERRVGLISQEEVIKELRAEKERNLKNIHQLKAERDEVKTGASRRDAQVGALEEENKRLSKMLVESQTGGGGGGGGDAVMRLTNELKDLKVEFRKVEADRDRRAFVRDLYGKDIDDPTGYDLWVNTGTMSLEHAADVQHRDVARADADPHRQRDAAIASRATCFMPRRVTACRTVPICARPAKDAEFVFLCVQTPMGADGSADLRALDDAAREIAPVLQPGAIVINKSTVPVGSTVRVDRVLREAGAVADVGVASNPEFLREGTAVRDFLHPSRVVVGAEDTGIAVRVSELYKGVLDDTSSGVFNGRIIVRRDAQKTSAQQTNKNLLLSEDALVNSNPQLEIHADDVKCAHGATIGQLDKESLFYLRSRGIGLEEARAMLTRAFMADVSERIRVAAVRDALRALVLAEAA